MENFEKQGKQGTILPRILTIPRGIKKKMFSNMYSLTVWIFSKFNFNNDIEQSRTTVKSIKWL